MCKVKGVTLMELLLFITLASLFVMVFIPKINISTVPFKLAVEKLKHDIRYAQWMAMNRKTVYGVVFDPNAEQYSVYIQNASSIVADPYNPAKNYTVNYTTDSKLRDVDLVSANMNGTNQVEFNGAGIPCDTSHTPIVNAGTVVLNYGGVNSTIRIEPNTGMVSVQ